MGAREPAAELDEAEAVCCCVNEPPDRALFDISWRKRSEVGLVFQKTPVFGELSSKDSWLKAPPGVRGRGGTSRKLTGETLRCASWEFKGSCSWSAFVV